MDMDKLKEKELPKYEPPQVVTYTGDEILEELGPAETCSYHGSCSPGFT